MFPFLIPDFAGEWTNPIPSSRLPRRGAGQWQRHPARGGPGATRTPHHSHRARGDNGDSGDNVAEGHHDPSLERGPRGDTGGEPNPHLLGCPSPLLVPRPLRAAGPARALCHLPEDQGQRDPGPGHERQRLLRFGSPGPAPCP